MTKKKREKPGEKREREAAEKKAKWRKEEEDRKKAKEAADMKAKEEADRKEKEEKERERKLKEDKYIKKVKPDTKPHKSGAKAAGLKSALILDENRILTTSFGKGNAAKREEYIIKEGQGFKKESADNTKETTVVSVIRAEKRSMEIEGFKGNKTTINNPLYIKEMNEGGEDAEQASMPHTPGMDVIKCKPQLEKLYFGKTFNDNLHIQLIYNILDIEKLLTVHVNNIVYMVNNLRRSSNSQTTDIIGCLSNKSYEKFKSEKEKYDAFSDLVNKSQLKYLGSFFERNEKEEKKYDTVEGKRHYPEFEKRIYNTLRVLYWVRQAVAHGNDDARDFLYRLDEKKVQREGYIETKEMLDEIYSRKVKELNVGFFKKSEKDIDFLSELFPNIKNEIPKKYYDFVVRKSFKNMGFSVKHLREMLIAENEKAKFVSDDERKSIRQKLNRYLDFSIYFAYEENPTRLEELVENLRNCSNEEEKERKYFEELDWLWGEIGDKVKKIEDLNGKRFATSKNEADRSKYSIEEKDLIPETATCFSEIIYLLTLFLDGKEINDLLTQLINKFDNIKGFVDIMQKEGISCVIKERYKVIQERSGDIATELRIINSFARMEEPSKDAKKVMYEEAALLLGYEGDDLAGYLEKEFLTKVKRKMGYRNFICNNVIESSRFKYLVRYADPKKVRKLANNKMVVNFVIGRIPDEQIKSFYDRCCVGRTTDYKKMREELSEKIVGLTLTSFENTKTSEKEKNERKYEEEKERSKNIVRLYLTILYQLVKNLVYVNSRYFHAFQCVERDAGLGGGGIEKITPRNFSVKKDEGKIMENGWKTYAEKFVDKHQKKPRVKAYLERDFNNADEWALATFRNGTEHLNAIRNADRYIDDISKFDSYFELYHYLVQRQIKSEFDYEIGKVDIKKENHEKLYAYLGMVNSYKSYNKDFVKALCVPFAYNLARFKNLSMEPLFDRNHYLPEKAKEEWMETASD